MSKCFNNEITSLISHRKWSASRPGLPKYIISQTCPAHSAEQLTYVDIVTSSQFMRVYIDIVKLSCISSRLDAVSWQLQQPSSKLVLHESTGILISDAAGGRNKKSNVALAGCDVLSWSVEVLGNIIHRLELHHQKSGTGSKIFCMQNVCSCFFKKKMFYHIFTDNI